MKQRTLMTAALLMSAGLLAAPGCSKTGPVVSTATTTQPAPKEMTHVLTKDEPYFEAMPSSSAKPAGTLKSGTKVLLLIPGSPYCQVETTEGTQVYTMTDGVDSLAAPPPPKPKKVAASTTKPVAVVVPKIVTPATKPVVVDAPKPKEMTHTLTKAQPYFAEMPVDPAAKPAGTLPGGTKVLLLIPGTPYCQVEMPDGTTVYTMIDGVESIAKK